MVFIYWGWDTAVAVNEETKDRNKTPGRAAILSTFILLLTYALACAWYYRRNLTSSARTLWMQGILPLTGGLMLYFLGGWSVWLDYDVATANDYTMWTVPWLHWQIGGAFVIAAAAALIGLACYFYCRFVNPSFFRKGTLTRATRTLAPDPDVAPPTSGAGPAA